MKNTLSKILSVALSLALVCLMCITASAAQLSGNGTKNNPYVIGTASQLDEFSDMVAEGNSFSGKFIVLENDITASAEFTPIGSKEAPFSGTFDGNGKAISAIDVNQDYAGLFGYADGAVITDVTVSGNFRATDYAGAVVAYANDTVIDGCTVSALVYSDSYTGGVAGYLASGKISSCTTESSSTVGNFKEYCGGIAGFAADTVNNCANNAYTYGVKNVGGIVGYSTSDIISCTNTIAVNATKTNLGGITGLTEGSVRYCKNTGRISTNDANAGKTGGIAGVAYNAVIAECMSIGAVSATGSFTGGIAGYATKTEITDCITAANVSVSGDYAGGIFGFQLEGTTERCVMTAAATAGNGTAGAIGAIAQGTVTDCYYNSAKSSKAVVSGKAANTSGISTADLINANALTALDFDTVWTINEYHAEYPILEKIPYHTLDLSVSKEASCTEDGHIKGICTTCAKEIDEKTSAFGHSYMTVSSQNPTCTGTGYKDLLCSTCGATDTETLPATGHTDENTDGVCDVCNNDTAEKETPAEKNIFQKIADFFKSILNWIRSLFVK